MNDFTKEELQILSEYLDYPIEEIAGCERNRLQLVLKIQSMIDKYCDHDWNETFSEREYFRCSKCGDEA
jgi:hypothetical protein